MPMRLQLKLLLLMEICAHRYSDYNYSYSEVMQELHMILTLYLKLYFLHDTSSSEELY